MREDCVINLKSVFVKFGFFEVYVSILIFKENEVVCSYFDWVSLVIKKLLYGKIYDFFVE